ncbi:MCE family protein [Amycolatopsis sp. NPDC058986]|uniref:MCE family protein n=1 Tax=unclassified Amycolatopsis TaxID=2618356 RepID=UPI00366A5E65
MTAPSARTPNPGFRRGLRALAILVVLATALAGLTWWVFGPAGGSSRVTVYFGSAVGLYPGSTVRVLGVPVGRVDEVTPVGTRVRAELSVREGQAVPAGATAVVVAPSLVSDRYVQLSPVYTGGPRLESGAVIPVERTVTPVELDELYKSVNQLSTALGPAGANAGGALSNLLDVLAKNAQGNGATLNQTIKRFADATRTLAGTSGQLFGTVDGLRKFTTMLANNDGQVSEFTRQLQDVSGFLAAERGDLGGALGELANALELVRGFVRDNRGQLKSNVDKLAEISGVLVDQRQSLAEALDTAPNALDNLYHAINPATGALETRANLLEYFDKPAEVDSGRLPADAPPLPLPLAGPAYLGGGHS